MQKKFLLIVFGALFLLADLVVSLLFITGKSPMGLIGLSTPKITITPFPTLVIGTKRLEEAQTRETVKIIDNFYVTKETADKWQKLLDNVPVNPQEVLATASANGYVVILTSGKTDNFPELTFSWSGDKAVEPGTKIVGYYVYFGPKNTEIPFPEAGADDSVDPVDEGFFVDKNYYTFKNLKRGQTYYLYVQSKTNSKVSFYDVGMEKVGFLKTLPAKKLFVYKYE